MSTLFYTLSFYFIKICIFTFQTRIHGKIPATVVRPTFDCPIENCSFSSFRKSAIICHLGFGHDFFKQTDVEHLISGLNLKKLFEKERRKKETEDVEEDDKQVSNNTFELSSESSDDNVWEAANGEKSSEKTSTNSVQTIRILGVASIPSFREDPENKDDDDVIDLDSD
jgi:hypothetical protein